MALASAEPKKVGCVTLVTRSLKVKSWPVTPLSLAGVKPSIVPVELLPKNTGGFAVSTVMSTDVLYAPKPV